MNESQNNQLATDIQRRANSVGISIAELCRRAGVTRRWFEYFKKRTPKAVDAYVRVNNELKALEQRETNSNS